MHLTVEQALSVYPLSKGKLIAGRNGMSRIVKSVNVMDAPDITDWIKAGEMLFTTAYLMKDSPDDAIGLLRKLDQRGAAGLGIKLGRFWSDVPQPILEEAERLAFPLIELPFQFTFSDQMNGLFHAEMQKSTKVLHHVLDKQKRLMQFALRPDHISNLFHTILGIVGYPLAVVGSRGHLVFNATPFSEMQLLRGWPWKDHCQWVHTEEGRYYRIPLTEKDDCAGYAIFCPPDTPLMKVEEGLFLQAAEIISHHMGFIYKEYMDHSVQTDLGSLLVRYLKGAGSIGALTDGAERLGIRLFPESYQCVLTTVPEEAPANLREKALRDVREEMQYHPEMKEWNVVHFYIREGILSLFPADTFPGNGRLQAVLAGGLRGVLSSMPVECRPQIAVSNKKRKPEALADAYRQCQDTLRLARRLGVVDDIVQYETVELAYLFLHVPGAKMGHYCQEVLGPLLAKDPEYSQEMLRTLETFVENDGQLSETAKLLYIHRNTAAYRLEKIGELLGVDLKNISDLLRLKLVFLFRQMLKTGTQSESPQTLRMP
ncbi:MULTISPECIES: PucR family transcriptional regulator [Paenibacillus]|uniref:PucR family transcriptional regulator n=1 Tax=Paenibacillus TaxID=44249 RepID=UPI0022B87FA8|nr:PucR family transcriptional regulator [Paenibacillus caseinilyticus]MCZ8522677.1 PucR family transcriptional regulator ligand-binding domain-containing protein [Paenibacillus caseinilyticus]